MDELFDRGNVPVVIVRITTAAENQREINELNRLSAEARAWREMTAEARKTGAR